MKSTIKILDLHSLEDAGKIRKAVANNEGVVACQICIDKKEISIVYDNYCLKLESIIESIEDIGYTVI